MSRDVPASIDDQLNANLGALTTLARCVVFELNDGTVVGMSDHDATLETFVSGLGPVTIAAGADILSGDIQLSTGLDSGTTEITVPLGGIVTRSAVVGRRFNQATAWVFDLNWSEDVPDPLELMKGTVGDARLEEAVAVFEVRDNNDFWNINIGGILTPRCRADFGDALCGKVREEVAAVVTGVTSSMVFQTDLAGGAYADEHFRYGDCEFTSGSLADILPVEVVRFTALTGEVELFVPLPQDPQIGDAIILHNGCSRLKKSTDPTIPTCATHDNVPRFRGFDQVPGSDTYIKLAAPGGG